MERYKEVKMTRSKDRHGEQCLVTSMSEWKVKGMQETGEQEMMLTGGEDRTKS